MEGTPYSVWNKIELPNRTPEQVEQELLSLQFQYIENLAEGKIKSLENKEYSLYDMLERYSGLEHSIRTKYIKKIENREFDEGVFNMLKDSIFSDIVRSYEEDKNTWKDKVEAIVDINLKEADILIQIYNKDQTITVGAKKEKNTAGLINFDIIHNDELKEFGIEPEDSCIQIHLPDIFEQKKENKSIKTFFSDNSMATLATKIVDEHPEAKAVLADSWLIDSPIGKRIGFTVYGRKEKVPANPSFWGQFVDENGFINENRAGRFLKTGIPDFYVSSGLIKTEDFLKKYLPQDKRGQIQLKELSPSFIEKMEKIRETRKKIFDHIDSITVNEMEQALNENVYIKEFLQTEEGPVFLALMKEATEKHIRPGELEHKDFKRIFKAFTDYFEKEKYVNKEVIV